MWLHVKPQQFERSQYADKRSRGARRSKKRRRWHIRKCHLLIVTRLLSTFFILLPSPFYLHIDRYRSPFHNLAITFAFLPSPLPLLSPFTLTVYLLPFPLPFSSTSICLPFTLHALFSSLHFRFLRFTILPFSVYLLPYTCTFTASLTFTFTFLFYLVTCSPYLLTFTFTVYVHPFTILPFTFYRFTFSSLPLPSTVYLF